MDCAAAGKIFSGAAADSAISLFFPDALSAALDRRPERNHGRSRGRMYFAAAECARTHWRGFLGSRGGGLRLLAGGRGGKARGGELGGGAPGDAGAVGESQPRR